MSEPAITRIVLTGFMGSGKSTVGPRLAEHLGWHFLDLDDEIERREGRSIPAIFETGGEQYFRGLESAALTQVLTRTNLVLGLGGGAIETPGNRTVLLGAPHTAIVYLEAPLTTLLARCRTQDEQTGTLTRPLLDEAGVRLAERRPLYEQLAHYVVATDKQSVTQVVEGIAALWPSGQGNPPA